MPCSFCRTACFESNAQWGYHQYRLSTFNRSLEEGCTICLRLADDLGALDPWIGQDSEPKDAVYRWTLRKVAATRESSELVVLRLRPNLDDKTAVDLLDRRAKLPDRTFYILPEEDLKTETLSTEQLGDATNSEQTWSQIAEWVDNCVTNHPKCVRKHLGRNFMPTRLVDVGLSGSAWPPEFFPIVETKSKDIKALYATLSHCWGPPSMPFAELREENYQRFTTEGVSWKEIQTNRNFVHAIEVARKLGVRYIWIDSLCIIQKQQSNKDFGEEAYRMHQVYRNSYCNIAAADSKDREGGLFRTRTSDDLRRLVPAEYEPGQETPLFKKRRWRIVPQDIYEDQLMSRVLYTRGWIFQERLLSPRILHFTDTQVFWDCGTLTAAETLPSGLPLAVDANAATDRQWRSRLQEAALSVRALGDASLEDFWQTAVSSYTSCSLGMEEDKINAVWGVAKLVRDSLGEDFGCGLWVLNLAEQLCWRVVRGSGTEGTGERPPSLGHFPTWSWASVRGVIKVARRIPTEPRWWYVKSVDGEELRFKLKEPLFPNFGKGEERWRDEIIAMDREIAKIGPEEVHRAAQLTKERDAHLVSGRASGAAERVARLDNQPVLEVDTITFRGHVMRGTLKKNRQTNRWIVSIPTKDGGREREDFIQAFPDTFLEDQESPCEFVFLSVARQVYGEWSASGSGDEGYEEEELDYALYKGIGILVHRVGDTEFKRTGAITFEGLTHMAWVHLRQSCCKGRWDIATGEHDLDDGQEVVLH